MRFLKPSFSDHLNPKLAASGNLLEIGKYFVLYVECIRESLGDMLKFIMEKLPSNQIFVKETLMNIFTLFDTLYNEFSADGWWYFLKEVDEENDDNDDIQILGVSATPATVQNAFKTPPPFRKINSIAKNITRSPIADAIDSPTMKYIRAERELKQLRKKFTEVEIKSEETEYKNNQLEYENRQLKATIADNLTKIANDRVDHKRAEARHEELRIELTDQTNKVGILSQEISEHRAMIRSLQGQLGNAEKESYELTSTNKSLKNENGKLLKSMRELQDMNQADFQKWNKWKQQLLEQKTNLETEKEALGDDLAAANSTIKELTAEFEHLKVVVEQKDVDLGLSGMKIEKLNVKVEKNMANHQNAMESLKAQHAIVMENEKSKRRMIEEKVERLEIEMQNVDFEKNHLINVLNSTEERDMKKTMNENELKDSYRMAASSLATLKTQNVLLEAEKNGKTKVIESLKSQLNKMTKTVQNQSEYSSNLFDCFEKELFILNQTIRVQQENQKRSEKQEKELDMLRKQYDELNNTYENDIKLKNEQQKILKLITNQKTQELDRMKQQLDYLNEKGKNDDYTMSFFNMEYSLKRDFKKYVKKQTTSLKWLRSG